MPLENLHKQAFEAAEASHCAGEQDKYWEMHDRLFENYKTLAPFAPHAEALGLDVAAFEACLSSGKYEQAIRNDVSAARRVGLTGTPGFLLALTDPKSSKVRVLSVLKGAKPFDTFKGEIDRLLDRAAKGELGAVEVAPSRSAKPVTASTLEADTVGNLQRVLLTAPAGSPAWIAAPRSDPRAIARAEDLAKVFESAGWKVEAVKKTDVNVRPGTYLFAGEAQPPAYIETVRLAMDNAGFEPSFATGYRDYYDQQKAANAGFRGFPFEDGQTFVLVIGRVP